MGGEHNLIQAPEIIRRLQRRFGLRQAHVLPTMNEGVQPVVVLDDLTRAETGALSGPDVVAGTRTCGFGSYVTGTAGQFLNFCLINPAGSGVFVLVDAFWISTEVQLLHDVGLCNESDIAGTTALPVTVETFLNTGVPGWASGAIKPRATLVARANAVGLVFSRVWAGWTRESAAQPCSGIPWPIVLIPGTALVTQSFIGALAASFAAHTREVDIATQPV